MNDGFGKNKSDTVDQAPHTKPASESQADSCLAPAGPSSALPYGLDKSDRRDVQHDRIVDSDWVKTENQRAQMDTILYVIGWSAFQIDIAEVFNLKRRLQHFRHTNLKNAQPMAIGSDIKLEQNSTACRPPTLLKADSLAS